MLLSEDYGRKLPIPPTASGGPLPLTTAWAKTVFRQQHFIL